MKEDVHGDEVPEWIKKLDPKKDQDGAWLVRYLTSRNISIHRNSGEDTREAAKRIVIKFYQQADPIHYQLLRNLSESYRQRQKRRDKREYVDRTYRLSKSAVDKLDGLAAKLEVPKEKIVEALIEEQANVDSLYDLSDKKGAKLTSEQIARSYAKFNRVGDLIFGTRAFPNEEQLVQRIKAIVKKLNISIARRRDSKPLLTTHEFVRVMEKEGVLYDVGKSVANTDSFERLKDPISDTRLGDYSDDLMIEDFIYLSETIESRLRQYRSAVYKHDDIRSEELLIGKLVDDAYSWYRENVETKSLRQECDHLRRQVNSHRSELAKQVKDIEFDDERFSEIVKLCENLQSMVIKLFEEYDLEKLNHYLDVEGLKGNAPSRRPNRFQDIERMRSIKKFRETVALAITGNVEPDSVLDHEFRWISER
ncbi:hypothetical protein [Idiomarina seosinensis]|uniref:Uncharacterized protein n=1 Tax=Idiomarina seosinensis TaxID=281739 RepID=A0A432ZIZ7_9GAMM|nr:hypothetical protein [Idiomarina seosinensis]RUO77864.1 hypothetical protein CWI81_05120 [Idiomarina seosinensis]